VSTASTGVRIGIGWVGLWSRRIPSLLPLAVRTVGTADGHTEGVLRDEVIAMFRDSAELCWREMRRGVDDIDNATRGAADFAEPRRPYRAKS
jgi:hypothetical protein